MRVRMKAKGLYFQKIKKMFFFKRLKKFCLKKKIPTTQKNRKKSTFFKNTFLAQKWSKMIFFARKWFHSKVWAILWIFGPGYFFHTIFSFCCKSAWKFAFFANFHKIPKKSQKIDFFQKTFFALKWSKMIFFDMKVVSFESLGNFANFWPWVLFSYDFYFLL